MKSIFAAAAVAAGVLVAQAAGAQTQNWKIQTSAQAGDFYYKAIEKWLPVLTTMTGGKVKAELTPIGSVVPHNQTIDAVAQGIWPPPTSQWVQHQNNKLMVPAAFSPLH